jgi:hypothetical protein
MKQLILKIEEGKFKAFLSFIKTLDYVTVSEAEEIPLWQQNEVKKRLEKVDNGEMKVRNWEEAKDDIFKA